MANETMMQYFEWYLPDDGNHWKRLKEDASHLSDMGITSVWMPPQTKATGTNDVGYGAYDLFDLGEFDQKGAVRTKYGTREEYLDAIETLHDYDIKALGDVVLNHKAGADETETFRAHKVNPDNREQAISDSEEIEGWTKFTFPGRGDKYSDFKWDWTCFSGVDYDQKTQQKGIYMIEGFEKGWAQSGLVDNENGNYDYLMFADVDFENDRVAVHLLDWAVWYLKETNLDGFRFDALKHIDRSYIDKMLEELHEIKDDFYAVGEYWDADPNELISYTSSTQHQLDLFDVPLHFHLSDASKSGNRYNMGSLLDNTLLLNRPDDAVTFVDNHDSQPGQSLESWVEPWFKQMAYALILLNEGGTPCIFYGDYYGIGGDHPQDGQKDKIDPLLYLRKNRAYGEQFNYFDHWNCVGYSRRGLRDYPCSGLALVMSNSDEGWKTMYVGEEHAGEVWIDYLGNYQGEVTIGDDGKAEFHCPPGSCSVWTNREEPSLSYQKAMKLNDTLAVDELVNEVKEADVNVEDQVKEEDSPSPNDSDDDSSLHLTDKDRELLAEGKNWRLYFQRKP